MLSPVQVTLTTFDAAEFGPVPRLFTAATRNENAVLEVRPVMVCVVAVDRNVRGGCATLPMNGVTT